MAAVVNLLIVNLFLSPLDPVTFWPVTALSGCTVSQSHPHAGHRLEASVTWRAWATCVPFAAVGVLRVCQATLFSLQLFVGTAPLR